MNARNLLGLIAAGRLIISIAMLLAPRKVGEGWLGAGAQSGEAQAFLKTTGVRDAGYAIGSLHAVRTGADPKPWLAAGIAIDGVDAVATLAAEGVPLKTRLVGSIGAVLAIVANVVGLTLGES